MKQVLSLLFVASLVLLSCGQNQSEDKTTTGGSETKSEAKANDGKELFANYCMQCHALNDDKTGPKLSGVLGRWGNDTGKLLSFIKNSTALVNSNDPDAIKVYHKWNNMAMPAFESLKDDQIKAIINYVNAGVE